MNSLIEILHNGVLIAAISAWAVAQIIKTIITCITTKRFDITRMVSSGGMPSAHSATVCALTIAVSRAEGVSSPIFALSIIFAIIVMYDAMGVRRAAGEHARVINEMRRVDPQNMEDTAALSLLDEDGENYGEKELKEFIGHKPLEVMVGALLGILTAMIVPV